MAPLREIVTHLDRLLRTAELPDYPNALNGLQVESDGDVTRVAAAVDARESTINHAVELGARLLIVHHGLFWGGLLPLVGPQQRRIRALLDGGLALYSAHLPLDAHPEIGNAVLLARELGLTPSGGFARFLGIDVGVMGDDDLATTELLERVRRFSAAHDTHVVHTPVADRRRTRRWAICTGAGADVDTLREARERGVDTFIVGEGPHWSAIDADESGITLIYAGHYATETLGVLALARELESEFGVGWDFIEDPTGL